MWRVEVIAFLSSAICFSRDSNASNRLIFSENSVRRASSLFIACGAPFPANLSTVSPASTPIAVAASLVTLAVSLKFSIKPTHTPMTFASCGTHSSGSGCSCRSTSFLSTIGAAGSQLCGVYMQILSTSRVYASRRFITSGDAPAR
ncbi:hypothetical protein FN846DRAFT_924490 [Sphaerosporella brunnea]|uniref:Uncharacterized protein n=1 Tax=Sphaerosporella brunnea TaxID=1250544 RepID=A0A5J5FBR8_9PEZI|nr:hypothetical protein FN846DRAFT_924490 [Sphaerosporella brunnea]